MKKLLLEIDCDETTCGRCQWADPTAAGACFLWSKAMTSGQRIKECLAATHAAAAINWEAGVCTGFEVAQEHAEVSEHDGWHRTDPCIDWTAAKKRLAVLLARKEAVKRLYKVVFGKQVMEFETREEAQRWVDFIKSVPLDDGPVDVRLVEYAPVGDKS